MKKAVRALCNGLVLCPLLGWSIHSAAVTAAGVEMTVAQSARSALILDVMLRNGTDRAIEIPNVQLPWGDRYSMTVLGIDPTHRRTPLSAVEFQGVPTAGVSVIAPGEAIRGQIDVTEYVGGIREELSKSDITVVWRYDLRDGAIAGARFSGTLVLGKGAQ